MVAKAPKECAAPGCHELTNNNHGYCNEHEYMKKEYRNNKYDQFYQSTAWDNKKISIKNRDYGLCIRCLIRKDRTRESGTVHHIQEIKDNWTLRLSNMNLISVCYSCHKQIHDMYKKDSLAKKVEQQKLTKDLKEFIEKY